MFFLVTLLLHLPSYGYRWFIVLLLPKMVLHFYVSSFYLNTPIFYQQFIDIVLHPVECVSCGRSRFTGMFFISKLSFWLDYNILILINRITLSVRKVPIRLVASMSRMLLAWSLFYGFTFSWSRNSWTSYSCKSQNSFFPILYFHCFF